jgi:hypothetical protein
MKTFKNSHILAKFAAPAIGLALALSASAADFPAPEKYTPAAKGKELDGLLKAKLSWLGGKIKADRKQLKELGSPDVQEDKEAIKKAKADVENDEKERESLSEKDPLDPSHNTDARKNAKIIRKNVEAWIKELAAKRQAQQLESVNGKTKEDREAAKAEAQKLQASENALEHDLKAAIDDPATSGLFK